MLYHHRSSRKRDTDDDIDNYFKKFIVYLILKGSIEIDACSNTKKTGVIRTNVPHPGDAWREKNDDTGSKG